MATYIPEVYGPPVLVTHNRPVYTPGAAYTRVRLVPDLHLRAPIFTLEDVARIENALAVRGVYHVICDIPDSTVLVSTRLSPHSIIDLVSQAVGEAALIRVVEPSDIVVPGGVLFDRVGLLSASYDDLYAYPSYSTAGYAARALLNEPYDGRSYDNEFRPSRYYSYY